MSMIRDAVVRTLALADSFDMPLTAYEVWRYLIPDHEPGIMNRESGAPLVVVLEMLEELVRAGELVEENGYYAFADRRHLFEERLRRLAIAGRKRRRALRWARWIVRLPYTRGVFAYGSLATGNTKEGSDLDVLIVVAPGRMFLARFLVSLFTEMFGVRRSRDRVRDCICLNHYVTVDALALPVEYRNPVSAWLWARMYPLATRGTELGERFAQENAWVGNYVGQTGRPANRQSNRAADHHPLKGQSTHLRIIESMVDMLERIARSLQLRKIAQNPLTHQKGGRVSASDDMLIFHPELPEERRLQRYAERLAQFHIRA